MKLHSNIFGWEYVWEEFADEKGGSLVKDGQRIVAITVPMSGPDSSVVFTPAAHGTQVIANCLPFDDFVFHISVQNLIHKMEKVFGGHNIKTHDALFDSRYAIRSNNADAVRELLADASLREVILQEQIDELSLHSAGARIEHAADLPSGHGAVVLKRHVFFDKFEQLESAFLIVTRLLDALAKRQPSKQAQEAAPLAFPQPHRLHSPLLDR